MQVQAALPAGGWRLLFVRADLRLHRKIVVIDGHIGYTGSLNLADPRLFKKSAGVGQWVDAFARLQGPAVQALAYTFLEDWALETGDAHPAGARHAAGHDHAGHDHAGRRAGGHPGAGHGSWRAGSAPSRRLSSPPSIGRSRSWY